MEWSVFLGAFVGSLVATAMVVAAIVAWFAWDDHRRGMEGSRRPALDDILERQVEDHLINNFGTLFQGWKIYDDSPSEDTTTRTQHKPKGVQYQTGRRKGAGIIDILSIDPDGAIVVVELKKGKAPDTVVTQVDRYIQFVKENLATQGQSVKGLILAESIDNRLAYALRSRADVDVWTYTWDLAFDKSAVKRSS